MLRRQQRRIFSLRRIAHHLRGHRFEEGSDKALTITDDIVQFGVYTGGGLKAWADAMPLLGFNFSGRLVGFDSFAGMPLEESSLLLRHHKQDPAWAKGGLNAAAVMGSEDWPALKETLISNIGYARAKTILVKGFFNVTLRAAAQPARRWLQGAFLVDIDCDLFTSTTQALAFALETRVLRPGSFVYYDDLSEYDRKEHKRVMHLNEENLAHHNISAAWGLRWRTLPSLGKYPGPIGLAHQPASSAVGASATIPGPLAWVEQFPASHTGRWIPPERYPAVLQLVSCERCTA